MNFLIDNKTVFSTDTGAEFDSNKHSIILLHGSGQSHVVWSLTAQYLSDQDYNVFKNNRGYGHLVRKSD